MAADEEMLVGEAVRRRFDSFARVLAYWSQHADPDGTEDDAARNLSSRRFHLSQPGTAREGVGADIGGVLVSFHQSPAPGTKPWRRVFSLTVTGSTNCRR